MNMTKRHLWSFGGGPGSISYKLFDVMRNALNRNLSAYLHHKIFNGVDGQFSTLEAGSGPGYCSSLLMTMENVIIVDHIKKFNILGLQN